MTAPVPHAGASPEARPPRAVSEDLLARMAELCDEATPGPWHVEAIGADDSNVCIKHAHFDLYRYEARLETTRAEPGLTEAELSSRVANVACVLADRGVDACLMAEARAAIPALLAEISRLRATAAPVSAPVSARVPLSEAEPDGRVSVPKYPSGVVTYTKDSRGWTIRTEDGYRGSLATDSDDVWIRARFSEALTALAAARAALATAQLGLSNQQSPLSEAKRREEALQAERDDLMRAISLAHENLVFDANANEPSSRVDFATEILAEAWNNGARAARPAVSRDTPGKWLDGSAVRDVVENVNAYDRLDPASRAARSGEPTT